MSNYNPDTQLVKELAFVNCRDLGGMPLSGGKTFRKGIFLRSESPQWIPEEAIQQVKDYGVKTVIDLRGEEEIRQDGNPFIGDPDVEYHNVPLLNGNPNDTMDQTMEYLRTHILGDYYIIIAEEMGDRLVEIMRVLLNSDGLALFHCQHGKDRTGVVAAILYLIAGADREDIIRNYEVSAYYLRDLLAPIIRKMPPDLRHALNSDRENMIKFLDYLDNKWDGSAGNLLISKGLTQDELTRLKSKCIED
ncbi:MAG: tyrosine-protein phosphatase [Clostridiales bacterium]|nr:tyrosine-protein phosphatase [Clostridiales bacterium]